MEKLNRVKDFIKDNKRNIVIAGIVMKIVTTLAFFQYKACTEIEVLPPKQMDKEKTTHEE